MDRSPLSFAVSRRHHSDSALPFAPLHPKPVAHAAMLPDFRLAPRSYSPASLDAYRLRSSAPSSASAISIAASSTVSTSSSPSPSPSPSDRALPPISSILAGSVEAAAALAYCAATAASSSTAPRDRAHSWPTRPLPPAAVLAPTPILAKDTPASSIANSPAPSSVFSAAGSPYSVASDLDCGHSNHTAAAGRCHFAEPDRASSPAPTAASEGLYPVLAHTDVTTIDGRPAFNSYLQKPIPATSPRQQHHSDSASPSTTADRYVCQVCTRAFSRPSSLRIHSHSHTGEKPFVCGHDGCGKAFSVRSNMKRHERGCHAV
ncbi:hypothetical protein V1517DRAFT_130260 [Lipomyces orientalis]|uniref:Uncharacterized protein n=1 Tax=Lipomyces orientalis TaxID=1233043 RepID=A0ACC3TN73_9ASCO